MSDSFRQTDGNDEKSFSKIGGIMVHKPMIKTALPRRCTRTLFYNKFATCNSLTTYPNNAHDHINLGLHIKDGALVKLGQQLLNTQSVSTLMQSANHSYQGCKLATFLITPNDSLTTFIRRLSFHFLRQYILVYLMRAKKFFVVTSYFCKKLVLHFFRCIAHNGLNQSL